MCKIADDSHRRLASRLPIPIATSSLVQIPSILSLIPPARTVGILTYDHTRLGVTHLEKLGISPARCHIRGAPPEGNLRGHIQHGRQYLYEAIAKELKATAKDMITQFPDIAAIVLECTNMAPFAEVIQSAVHMPVYDVYTMGSWFYSGIVNLRPKRWEPILEDTIETRI